MISFSPSEEQQMIVEAVRAFAEEQMRPAAHAADESGHPPADVIQTGWEMGLLAGAIPEEMGGFGEHSALTGVLAAEELAWGDLSLALHMMTPALFALPVLLAGTEEQQRRYLPDFCEDRSDDVGSGLETGSGGGCDQRGIPDELRMAQMVAEYVMRPISRHFDEHEHEIPWDYINALNGEKIFITGGRLAFEESDGLIVVWATVDPSAGRAGMKPFVVEAGTPGARITKVEDKLGIRASDTAALVLNDCRIPYDNLLGSAEVRRRDGSRAGFKGAMATFDATRPIVAASALGVARAALELTKEKLAEEGIAIRHGEPRHALSAVEREVLEMETQYKAAWLLTLRAASMMDRRQPNTLEASMCKVKAGKAVTWITQKAVELLGPLGYSRELLAEKWMRDGKINDIFEGTGQINTLIVARRILGYGSNELR